MITSNQKITEFRGLIIRRTRRPYKVTKLQVHAPDPSRKALTFRIVAASFDFEISPLESTNMNALSRLFAIVVILGLFTIPAALATTPPVEDQPHMQEALDALKQARHHLEQAIPDKGGHRTAAIKACDEAIKHAEESIKYSSEIDDRIRK